MNIILASHGSLCTGLMETFTTMVSCDCPLQAVALGSKGVDEFRAELVETVNRSLEDGPTLILTDLLGGTPYNEAYALFLQHPDDLRVVSGVNFGMLIEVAVATASLDDLNEAAQLAVNAGVQGICCPEYPAESEPISDDDLF